MSPRHHPEPALLVDYATGALDVGPRLVLAAHLGACPACRAEVALAEAVGGAVLDALPPAPLSPDALDRALARIERPAPSRAAPRSRADWISVPAPVLQAAERRRRWAAPGVWVARISQRGDRNRAYLLRVGAGMSMPLHSHRGTEMVCVLKGGYRDGDVLHHAGDFALNDETVEHRPQITAEGECVCLIAADGALAPRDWVGRLAQPFVGI